MTHSYNGIGNSMNVNELAFIISKDPELADMLLSNGLHIESPEDTYNIGGYVG